MYMTEEVDIAIGAEMGTFFVICNIEGTVFNFLIFYIYLPYLSTLNTACLKIVTISWENFILLVKLHIFRRPPNIYFV